MTTEPPTRTPTNAMGDAVPPPSLRLPGIRQALLATSLVGVLLVLVAGLTAGRAGVLGAVFGVTLVCSFFLFGAFNTGLAATYAPRASLLVALLTYTVQVVALALVLAGVSRSGLAEETIDVRWLSGTVIVGTLVWTGALVACTLSGPEARR
jgi:ATP synthase protein I